MYHDMESTPEDQNPGMFKCIRKNDVYFSPAKDSQDVQDPADAAAKTNQVGGAKLVPNSAWQSDLVSIVFSVRWSPNGLMPVRPQIVLMMDVTLPAGHGCKLSS